jgi:mycofactocin precursor peptide peptidase
MTQLANLSWPEVGQRAAAGALLAVPLGSTEQHGPHLPVSTDTDLASALCDRLAGERNDVIVAPAVAYGSSGEHAGFPGTLSIGHQVIEELVVELVRSASETFARVLLVSAHGGNAEPVSRAVRRLRAESRDVLLYAPAWDGDAHAGRSETSLQLWLQPGRVAFERAEVGNVQPLSEILPALRRHGVRPVSRNGVLGDPRDASRQHGHQLFNQLANDLRRAVASWRAACPA